MFIAHLGVGLAAKRVAPGASLGVLLLTAAGHRTVTTTLPRARPCSKCRMASAASLRGSRPVPADVPDPKRQHHEMVK